MIFELDDKIPFSKRHKDETIRQILRYDSGYLRDLMLKDDRMIFSNSCFCEMKKLTQKHYDNWENPHKMSENIFNDLKIYKSPYLYNFNDKVLEELNSKRLNQQ